MVVDVSTKNIKSGFPGGNSQMMETNKEYK